MNARIPGPLCRVFGHVVHELDDGTLARVVSPVPRSLGAPTTATKQAQSPAAQSAATTMIELPLDVYLLNLSNHAGHDRNIRSRGGEGEANPKKESTQRRGNH